MRELTAAEEKVMQILWKIKNGFVKDIQENFQDPVPAYNTISTFIRILEKKGYVGFKAYGRSHEYFPLVTKNQYRRIVINNLLNKYFGNSPEKIIAFLVKEDHLTLKELEEMAADFKKGKKK